MSTRVVGIAVAVAASVLLAVSLAFYFTYQPSADIGLSWRLGVTTETRRAHERRFSLVNRRVQQGRMRYDMLDLRRENVRAILAEPDIEDTDGIDRIAEDLPMDYRYGKRWTWVGARVPVLRSTVVIAGIAFACLTIAGAGAGYLTRARRTKPSASH